MLVSAALAYNAERGADSGILNSAYLGMVTPVYSFSLFLPSIIAAMGYSAAKSQLLTVVSNSYCDPEAEYTHSFDSHPTSLAAWPQSLQGT